MSEIVYPEHEHPHGVENTHADSHRIWVCGECNHLFTDDEIRNDSEGWGHTCKSHPVRKGQRCESHLEPYMPDEVAIGQKGRRR